MENNKFILIISIIFGMATIIFSTLGLLGIISVDIRIIFICVGVINLINGLTQIKQEKKSVGVFSIITSIVMFLTTLFY